MAFKMKGFSGFKSSPMKNDPWDGKFPGAYEKHKATTPSHGGTPENYKKLKESGQWDKWSEMDKKADSPAKHMVASGYGDHNRMNHWDPETESFSKKGHGERKQKEPVKPVSQKEENEADYDRKLNALLSKPGLTQADVDEWKKKNPAPTGPLKHAYTPLHKPAPTKFIGALIQGAATSTLSKGDKDLMKKHKMHKSTKEMLEEEGTATSA